MTRARNANRCSVEPAPAHILSVARSASVSTMTAGVMVTHDSTFANLCNYVLGSDLLWISAISKKSKQQIAVDKNHDGQNTVGCDGRG